MDPFYMYVSIGALVLLILILTVIGVAMTQLQSLDPFPPTMNACPDYWDVSSNPAYCGVPVNQNMNNRGYIITTNGIVDTANNQNIGMCIGNSSSFGCKKDTTYLSLDPQPSASSFQYVKLNNNPNY